MSDSSNTSASSFWSPGLFSLGAAGISFYYSFNSAAAGNFDSTDKLLLSSITASAVYVGFKIGGKLGRLALGFAGLALGGVVGSGGGAVLGGLATMKENGLRGAFNGLAAGGLTTAAMFGIVGTIAGSLGGNYLGARFAHDLATESAHRHVFKIEDAPAHEIKTIEEKSSEYFEERIREPKPLRENQRSTIPQPQ